VAGQLHSGRDLDDFTSFSSRLRASYYHPLNPSRFPSFDGIPMSLPAWYAQRALNPQSAGFTRRNAGDPIADLM